MRITHSFSHIHRLSQLFQPLNVIPKTVQIKHQDITSRSQKLMLDLGIIKQSSPGCFHLLPLAVRSLDKLIDLVDSEMRQIGGQKLKFPTLTGAKLWKLSGRLESMGPELFTLQDRHNQSYILSPTHEEAVSDLIASIGPLSYKHYPLKLYQITSKFRDEIKPRFGLMRAKQFLMKDMYSFDVDLDQAKQTYEEVCHSYGRIFNQIGVHFVKVAGSTGHIGGLKSHEYHYLAQVGEDKICLCTQCGQSANVEVLNEECCPKCKIPLIIKCGIEVGHTFLLGDKYSQTIGANYLDKNAKPKVLQMGCYGLGLSRILAASLEVLSSDDELRWPFVLAPFKIIIIPPKQGSKEAVNLEGSNIVENLYTELETIWSDDVIIDDRLSLTIGKRYMEAKRVGYPFVIVLGRKTLEDPPLYELTVVEDNKKLYLSKNQLVDYITTSVGSSGVKKQHESY